MIENHIRRAAVSSNCHFKSDDPYHIAPTLKVDKHGLHIVVVSKTTRSVEGVIRQKVLRTLEENGIPNEVVHIDPTTTVHGVATFFNQNAVNGVGQGRATMGFRRTFTFGLTEEAAGWFGEGSQTLRLV